MFTPNVGEPNGAVLSDSLENGIPEKKSPTSATFPNGFEVFFFNSFCSTRLI